MFIQTLQVIYYCYLPYSPKKELSFTWLISNEPVVAEDLKR